jgi:polysaccharide biosynthesis/export protein
MISRLACMFAFAVGVGGCATTAYDYSKEPDPRKSEFVIGAGDVLRVNVWKNNELTGDARVRPDGTITMPLIGDVSAAGRTPSALKAEITKRLSAYVKDEASIVSVAVSDVNSYRFTVSGNVEHAGVQSSKYYVTASEAIAMAGGLNKFASPHKLVVIRNDKLGFRRIPLDYARVASGQHPDEDLVMLTGDTLFVP